MGVCEYTRACSEGGGKPRPDFMKLCLEDRFDHECPLSLCSRITGWLSDYLRNFTKPEICVPTTCFWCCCALCCGCVLMAVRKVREACGSEDADAPEVREVQENNFDEESDTTESQSGGETETSDESDSSKN